MWIAASLGHMEIVRLLKSLNANESIKCEGTTPLEIAKKKGQIQVAYFLRAHSEYFPRLTQVAPQARRVSH